MPTITKLEVTNPFNGETITHVMEQYPDGHTVVYSPADPNYATLLEQMTPTAQ